MKFAVKLHSMQKMSRLPNFDNTKTTGNMLTKEESSIWAGNSFQFHSQYDRNNQFWIIQTNEMQKYHNISDIHQVGRPKIKIIKSKKIK